MKRFSRTVLALSLGAAPMGASCFGPSESAKTIYVGTYSAPGSFVSASTAGGTTVTCTIPITSAGTVRLELSDRAGATRIFIDGTRSQAGAPVITTSGSVPPNPSCPSLPAAPFNWQLTAGVSASQVTASGQGTGSGSTTAALVTGTVSGNTTLVNVQLTETGTESGSTKNVSTVFSVTLTKQ